MKCMSSVDAITPEKPGGSSFCRTLATSDTPHRESVPSSISSCPALRATEYSIVLQSLRRRSRERILAGNCLAKDKRVNIVSALIRIDRLEVVGMAADGVL